MNQAIISASLSSWRDGTHIHDVVRHARWLEIDGTRNGISADWVRHRFPGRIFHCMAGLQAPDAVRSSVDRRKQLAQAAKVFDLVDLDAAFDLAGEVQESVPIEKRVITWRGRANSA